MPKASSFAAWESPLQLARKREDLGGLWLAELKRSGPYRPARHHAILSRNTVTIFSH
jgi:hypothetical protein